MSSRKNWYSLILNLPKFVIMRTCHPSSQSNRAATPPGPATQASTMFWIDVPCCIMRRFNTGEMPGSRHRNRSYTTTSAETSRTKARRPLLGSPLCPGGLRCGQTCSESVRRLLSQGAPRRDAWLPFVYIIPKSLYKWWQATTPSAPSFLSVFLRNP